MTASDTPSGSVSPRERARHLILNDLGVRRVAAWCGVAEATVYQWLHRGTDQAPVPASRVPEILRGAQADKVHCPVTVLAPEMAAAIVGARG